YNVEKYLEDYFKSIINQRLDFQNNIFLILVDDGSKDASAQIIKEYQKKYPKNIAYLYKENGGQASARNLGLKYMRENNYQSRWVTFVDPDDFLDRNYFYEVDKFLEKNKNEDICMIGCNIIFYFEKNKSFRDEHSLKFKFQQGEKLITNKNLDNFIQLACNSALIKSSKICTLFDENLKPNFEDAKFINEYLLENLESKSAFLKNAMYFYRKRQDKSSTLDTKLQNKSYYLVVPKIGYLDLLQNIKGEIPYFIQNLILY
ncbi:glycosyltransferase, partial [Campylobacter coli]|nr:glycosyltransferase [Campylobacter coli]